MNVPHAKKCHSGEWMKEGVSVDGCSVCECVCYFAYLLVYTDAYMWEREADQWVRTPNDSALHGQDSCFMSMGFHKLHGPASLLLLLLQQNPVRSFPFLSLPFSTPFIFHSHASHLSTFAFSVAFLLRSKCQRNLFCQYILRCSMPLCKCYNKTITLRSALGCLLLNLHAVWKYTVVERRANLTQCVYLCTMCRLVTSHWTYWSVLQGASCMLLSNCVLAVQSQFQFS